MDAETYLFRVCALLNMRMRDPAMGYGGRRFIKTKSCAHADEGTAFLSCVRCSYVKEVRNDLLAVSSKHSLLRQADYQLREIWGANREMGINILPG